MTTLEILRAARAQDKCKRCGVRLSNPGRFDWLCRERRREHATQAFQAVLAMFDATIARLEGQNGD